eukprot:scpid19438/ scgid24685/ Anion exchange protein 3; Band 3-related protein 3; Neuronal band 3-like protein; Solute carrier family 4 member 3
MPQPKRRPPPPPPPVKPKPLPRTQASSQCVDNDDDDSAIYYEVPSQAQQQQAPTRHCQSIDEESTEASVRHSMKNFTASPYDVAQITPGRSHVRPVACVRKNSPDRRQLVDGNASCTVTANPYVVMPCSRQASLTGSATSSTERGEENFVEFLTLQGDGVKSHIEWHETARWIKFEESYEKDTGRWSQPHVSSLNYSVLSSLRSMFSDGEAMLLDIPTGACFTFHSVVLSLSDQLHSNGVLTNKTASEFRDLMMSPFIHHEQLARHHKPLTGVSSFLKRKMSTGRSAASPSRRRPHTIVSRAASAETTKPTQRVGNSHAPLRRSSTDFIEHGNSRYPQQAQRAAQTAKSGMPSVTSNGDEIFPQPFSTQIYPSKVCSVADAGGDSYDNEGNVTPSRRGSEAVLLYPGMGTCIPWSYQDVSPAQDEVLRTLPPDAEGSCVLAAEVDFVTRPVVFIARLALPYFMGDLLEVPLPMRSIVVVLNPRKQTYTTFPSASSAGRTMGALLADYQFRQRLDIAYSASEIAAYIEEYLETTVVLQRGPYGDHLLLPALKSCSTRRASNPDCNQVSHKATMKSAQQPKNELGAGQVDDSRVDADPLARTGRLFGGLRQDLQRLRRRFPSDFSDALSVQCLITTVVMYFGLVAPLIAFGSLLGEKTQETMGLAETLISASFGGALFSLFAGQPLMFISVTGPMAVFEAAIYRFCHDNGFDFFGFRFWTGLWIFVFLMVIVATDSSHLIKRFTPFTEEVFTALIAFIFIYESTSTIFQVFEDHPLRKVYECTAAQCLSASERLSAIQDNSNMSNMSNCTTQLVEWVGNSLGNESNSSQILNDSDLLARSATQPNTALFYLMLVFGTFSLAHALRSLKASRYMTKYTRRFFGDMSIFLSILVMYLVSRYVFHEVHNDKIIVPIGLQPTQARSWLIDPSPATTPGLVFGAALPGLLAAFLIFIETQVTCLLCSNSEHRLKKTGGYHWNLTLTAVLALACSALGLPWLCGQPVTSLIHTKSLLRVNSKVAPGEKPRVVGAHEQRVTGILINVLVGISVTSPVASVLSHIPMAVIMGIFFYMGFCNLLSLQFLQRVVLLFVPAKHHQSYSNKYSFIKFVSTVRMNVFTIVQLCCFAVLVACKMTKAGMVFPFFIALMIPVRDYILTKWLSPRELAALDPH